MSDEKNVATAPVAPVAVVEAKGVVSVGKDIALGAAKGAVVGAVKGAVTGALEGALLEANKAVVNAAAVKEVEATKAEAVKV